MTANRPNAPLALDALENAAAHAARQIPPLWPLASNVAVNPFLGQTEQSLAQTGARLARTGGIAVAMPRSWYDEQITTGRITGEHLAAALDASPHARKPQSVAALIAAASTPRPQRMPLPTIADLVAHEAGLDWPAIIADRIGSWAGGHFDQGQALWAAPASRSAWVDWRSYATHDLTPEILGLSRFPAFVAASPEKPTEAMARAAATLRLSAPALDTYFHQLLLSLGGWSQLTRYRLWRAELAGQTDTTIQELLAVRLLWEEALFLKHEALIADAWDLVVEAHEEPVAPDGQDIVDEILQEAAERSEQSRIAGLLALPAPVRPQVPAALQAVFCIDVRSEPYRRALEARDPAIRTSGFAGFFGITAQHKGFASDVEELRLPVLLNPGFESSATDCDHADSDLAARYRARAHRAWGRFKLAAVSSFAFVEAMGPVYLVKLVRDALGLGSARHPASPEPHLEPEPSLDTRIATAAGILRAMSLTEDFARIVLLVGHGANVTNNPHASSLHCGACGGHAGDVNARLLARLLNDPAVRAGLQDHAILIPDSTIFMGALHDTTTDAVTLFEDAPVRREHAADIARVRQWLDEASQAARDQRAKRFPDASDGGDVAARARDWAQTRPEWGLAGCSAFIAAPRSRTAGRDMAGRAFLHDYDWRKDQANGFAVLELILTAPVVVASWISLQYYGSTVAPEQFGAGNKLLHNAVGGIGVLEGNGGAMRTGLPWQSVHDGDRVVHEPLRLSVCVEAPCAAIEAILARHDGVRALFENRWLHLLALDEKGQISHRYAGGRQWTPMHRPQQVHEPELV